MTVVVYYCSRPIDGSTLVLMTPDSRLQLVCSTNTGIFKQSSHLKTKGRSPNGTFCTTPSFHRVHFILRFSINNFPYKTFNTFSCIRIGIFNVLYGELWNGKTKNEVNAVKARCPTKRPVGAATLGSMTSVSSLGIMISVSPLEIMTHHIRLN